MVKYSAVVLFATLAVFWTSTEARYNRYQDDVINAMTQWAIEEMRDIPEPHKTRITDKLKEAKNMHWENVGEYFKHIQKTMLEFVTDLLRVKRHAAHYNLHSDVSARIQSVREAFGDFSQ